VFILLAWSPYRSSPHGTTLPAAGYTSSDGAEYWSLMAQPPFTVGKVMKFNTSDPSHCDKYESPQLVFGQVVEDKST
jgi:hypothetical protein